MAVRWAGGMERREAEGELSVQEGVYNSGSSARYGGARLWRDLNVKSTTGTLYQSF